ncbi:MAG: DUF4097 family beta strand repeat-containing protein [Peptococcaceae bacterium]
MKKSIKVLLVTACTLCVIGALLVGIGIANGGRENLRENVSNVHTYTQEKTQLDAAITDLEVDINFANLIIKPSGNEHYYLSYHIDSASTTNPFSYDIENGLLHLQEADSEALYYERNAIDLLSLILEVDDENAIENSDSTVTLYVPKDALNAVDLQMEYGDLSLNDCTLPSIKCHLAYGDLNVTNAEWTAASFGLEYGDVNGTGLRCNGLTQFAADYGDVTLVQTTIPDTQSIQVTSEFGEVTINPAFGGTLTKSDSDYTQYERLSGTDGHLLSIQTEYGDIALQ